MIYSLKLRHIPDEGIGTPSVLTTEDPLILTLQYDTSTDMTEGGITNTFVLLSPEGTSKEIEIFLPYADIQDQFINVDPRELGFRETGSKLGVFTYRGLRHWL